LQTPPDEGAAVVENATVESAASSDKYLLRWAPQEGEERVFRLKVAQTVSAPAAAGQPELVALQQDVAIDYAMRIARVLDDGSFLSAVTFRAVRLWRKSGKRQQMFDSARPPKVLSEETAAYSALAGARVTMKFDARGRLVEVRDLDAFYNRILDALKIKPANRAAVRAAMGRSNTSSAAFRNVGNTIASFPEQNPAMGTSWPKRDALDTDARFALDGTATLAKVENNVATIALASSVVLNREPGEPGGFTAPGVPEVLPNITGTQSGEYEVEAFNGWTRAARLRQEITLPDESGAGGAQVVSEFTLRTLGTKPAPNAGAAG
jgi:hypothetical protein